MEFFDHESFNFNLRGIAPQNVIIKPRSVLSHFVSCRQSDALANFAETDISHASFRQFSYRRYVYDAFRFKSRNDTEMSIAFRRKRHGFISPVRISTEDYRQRTSPVLCTRALFKLPHITVSALFRRGVHSCASKTAAIINRRGVQRRAA